MYFDRDLKLETLCGDPTRPALVHVELTADGEKGTLCATNGVSLIRVPVTDCARDVSGPIPAAAFDVARKAARKAKAHMAEIICEREVLRFADGSTMPRPVRGEFETFPEVARVIPPKDPEALANLDSAIRKAHDSDSSQRYTLLLGVDPELLLKACKAKGLKGIVALEIPIDPGGSEAPVSVRAPLRIRCEDGSDLIVMPGRV